MRRDERFTVGDGAQLEVDITSGSVHVQVGATGSIQVSLDSSQPGNFEVDQLGNTVSIRPPTNWLARSGSLRLAVEVPPGADVAVSSSSAEVVVRGPVGAVRVRTSSGHVTVDRAEAADISCSSGHIRVGTVAGATALATSSGNIALAQVGGPLSASMSSGGLRAELVSGSMQIGTASGDVRVRRCDGEDITIKTVSGDVVLGLPSGIRVEPDISTLSGSTVMPTPATVQEPLTADRRQVRLRIRTVSGDIRIERAG
jgi:hypothetical protein